MVKDGKILYLPASRMKIVTRGGVIETAISVALELKLTWSVQRSNIRKGNERDFLK